MDIPYLKTTPVYIFTPEFQLIQFTQHVLYVVFDKT